MSLTRTANKYVEQHKKELYQRIQDFITEATDKSAEQVKILYKYHENMWQSYAKKINGTKGATLRHGDKEIFQANVLVDAFENAVCKDAVRSVRKRAKSKLAPTEYNELVRILRIVQHPNWFQKLFPNFFVMHNHATTGIPKMKNLPPPPNLKVAR